MFVSTTTCLVVSSCNTLRFFKQVFHDPTLCRYGQRIARLTVSMPTMFGPALVTRTDRTHTVTTLWPGEMVKHHVGCMSIITFGFMSDVYARRH